MTLAAGTRLGPYEIVAPLGAGGMGEVYRARDSRLGRDVAIKVLPEHLAQDPEALARFEREARAVAGLSHPNILAIHDIGVEDGTAFSVTELLVGETLRGRLAGAPLPVRKVLDYGTQIAQGLAAAHDRGIVHRDLKPENLFLTEDGRVKILDFGLAKFEAGASDGLTASPTVEIGTRPGTVMGTMGYMSPEQLRGADLDSRSDLFSFGAVLYEMLAGQKAFWRDTAADTMSAILKEDPPPLSSPSREIPPALQRIVEHCLEKNPVERFQSSRDLAFHLEDVGTSSSQVALPPIGGGTVRRRRPRAALALLAGLTLGLIAGALIASRWLSPAPAEPPVLRYLSYTGRESEPAAAPDGRLIAFTTTQAGRSSISVKQLPRGDEASLTDGPQDRSPRISPDGTQVLFTRVDGGRKALFRVPVVGGEPRKIVDDGYEGDWAPDGKQVVFLRDRHRDDGFEVAVALVDVAGTETRELIRIQRTELQQPRWSPDGGTIAVVQRGTENTPNQILLVDVASGKDRILEPPPPGGRLSSLAWNRGGGLLYSQAGSFLTSGVDLMPGRLILQDVESGGLRVLMWLPIAAMTLDILDAGRIVLGVRVGSQNLLEVPLRDLAVSGSPHWITRGTTLDRQPVFSPDGRWLLFSSNRDGNLDLWKLDRETGAVRHITEDDADDWDPAFGPDGRSILWSSNRTGSFEIWTCAPDGTGARQLTRDGFDAENPTMTAEGTWVVYNSTNPQGSGIWRIRPDGSEATLLVPGSWSVPDVSPDGRYVAFRSSSEPRNLRVARVEDGAIVAGPWSLPGSNESGRARWMPDGRHLLFVGIDDAGNQGVFIQEFSPGRETAATRRPLLGFDEGQRPESLAVSPDGSSIVYSSADDVRSLMAAEGLAAIAPARPAR